MIDPTDPNAIGFTKIARKLQVTVRTLQRWADDGRLSRRTSTRFFLEFGRVTCRHRVTTMAAVQEFFSKLEEDDKNPRRVSIAGKLMWGTTTSTQE